MSFWISENMMEMGLFTAAACRVLFTCEERGFSFSRPVRILARIDFSAAAATRVRAARLLQLYHSAPISWTRVNKRQRSCRFRGLQAEKVRHDPFIYNCMSSVSIFEVKTVKLSSVSALFFPWCVPACGSLVGPLPDRRSGHVTSARVPIPSSTTLHCLFPPNKIPPTPPPPPLLLQTTCFLHVLCSSVWHKGSWETMQRHLCRCFKAFCPTFWS